MHTDRAEFGTLPDGQRVDLFTLHNDHGMTVKVSTYGGTITEFHVPGRDGTIANVVLGFDTLAQYLTKHPYFGATVGRVANRIARGDVVIEGNHYPVNTNEKGNTLHGGTRGFDKVLWKAEKRRDDLQLTYVSPDGEMGFPGTLPAVVTFTLADRSNNLRIDYEAKVIDKPTVVNLTNHSYFNLAGASAGDILGHELTLAADQYLPVDDQL